MHSIGSGTVQLEHDGHRVDVVLDRPDKRNAMNQTLLGDLHTALNEVDSMEGVRAMTLLGNGPVFSAGMDLDMMKSLATSDRAEMGRFHDLLATLDDLSVPTVAGIKRAAIAGAFELTLPVDFRIIDREAKYGVKEVQLGTFPHGGATQRLPRLIGLSKAKQLVLTGDFIDPADAERCGLVHDVVDDPDDVDDRARDWADDLTRNAPLGMERAKGLLDSALDVPLEEGLEFESALGREMVETQDYFEGFAAHLEDREPEFQGE